MFIKVSLVVNGRTNGRHVVINTDHIQEMYDRFGKFGSVIVIDGDEISVGESIEDILDMIDDQIAHQEMIKHQVHKPKFKYDFDPLTDIAFYNYG